MSRLQVAVLKQAAGVGAMVLASIAIGSDAAAQVKFKAGEDFLEYLPPGDGKAVVEQKCTSCHDLGRVVLLRKSADDWKAQVAAEAKRGAMLTADETTAAANYLASVFGTEAPPLVDVNTASEDAIMRLPGVTKEGAHRLVENRFEFGFLASRDDVKRVLRLNDEAFAKIMYYVRVARPDGR
jgi:DNA uptake protein ComE-like DNA-binding protein